MPGKVDVGGVNLVGLGQLLFVLAIVLVPILLGRRGDSPGHPGTDSGPDDGDGPGGSPTRPNNPRGGIPLPDADPARARLRDHHRLPDLLPARARRRVPEPRRVREPQRRPSRAPRRG
jgi:hypothetical protein